MLRKTIEIVGLSFFLTAVANATFTVNTNDDVDDGNCDVTHCSLREALNASNMAIGLDTVNFMIAGDGPHTIKPLSPLPDIVDPIIIDGYTQPGSSVNTNGMREGANTVLMIELDGSLLPPGSSMFRLISSGNKLRGLVVNRVHCTASAIALSGGDNIIEGNFIGTDITGTLAQGNGACGGRLGLAILGSNNNLIGGNTPEARNVISDNNMGVLLDHAFGNTLQGNYIGTDITGTQPLGNWSGIYVIASSNNLFGGDEPEAGNLISANGYGIYVKDCCSGGNLLQGNFIGTDASGTLALGNGTGVVFQDSPNEVIGGFLPGSGNLISGNWMGVYILGAAASGHIVQGNFIGTDVTGSQIIGNTYHGVDIRMAAHDNSVVGNKVAGSQAGIGASDFARNNLIEDNTLESNTSEVYLLNSSGNTVHNNRLYPNYEGINLQGISQNNTVAGNLVVGGANGIRLYIDSTYNQVQGNTLIGQSNNGVVMHSANDNTIDNNLIRASAYGLSFANVTGTIITNNRIFSSALDGIQIGFESANNFVSGNTVSLSRRAASYISDTIESLLYNNTFDSNCIGLSLQGTSVNDQVTNNNFLNNGTQVRVLAPAVGENVFDLALPIGGNYWNDYDQPAESCDDIAPFDGICDSAYSFAGGADTLPWTEKNGWLANGEGQVADNSLFDFCQLQDFDGDTVLDDVDNCPFEQNPDQADADEDFIGNACDPDFDKDDDGVPDNADQCLDTDPGAVTDAQGCSIGQLCACSGPADGEAWENHGEYVSCVAHAAGVFVETGLISDKEIGHFVSEAARSSCGK